MNLFTYLISIPHLSSVSSVSSIATAITKATKVFGCGILSSTLLFSSLAAAQSLEHSAVQTEATSTEQLNDDAKMVRVDINSASAKQLAKTLKGIGKVKAAAIVAYRDDNGTFSDISDLVSVKGISAKLIERNRHLIKAL